LVRIITDSASDFEPNEYVEKNIVCVPLSVIVAGKEYIENEEITKTEFYEKLASTNEAPRTSQPSPYRMEKAFREAMEAGDEAVVIPISSGLSGTCQGFMAVKEDVGYEDCYIVDSLTGTGGVRMLVEYAVKLRDEGKSAKEIAEAVTEARSRVTLYTCMDTLEYLMRGGRISKSTYIVGSLAQIKPIMHVTPDGRPEIPAKVMGIRKGIDYLCKKIDQIEPDPDFPVYVMYTHVRTNGEQLAAALRKKGYDIPDSRIINVGAVVGTHIGPNACAIVYIAKK